MGEHFYPGYSAPPNSPAKADTLTQAAVSRPTAQLSGNTVTQATMSHLTAELRQTLLQSTVAHPTA